MSLSALLLLAALASFGSGFDDEDPGDLDRRVGLFAANQMPLRRVERPLSMPKSTYGLRFDLTYTELTRGTPLVRFFGAAGFGLTDDLELGILLLPLSFSPDPGTGLAPPSFFVRYRFLSGVAELAVTGDVQLPLGATTDLAAALPLRLHFGRWAKLDLALVAEAVVSTGFEPTLRAPVGAGVQILDRLAVELGGELFFTDVSRQRYLGKLWAFLGYTIPDGEAAFADLGVRVRSHDFVVSGSAPPDPREGNHFAIELLTRWYVLAEPEYERWAF